MSEYKHSIVLFSGEDGLPLEFNLQNVVEKVPLRGMIEHGGGLCTLSDNAIHLVSPGTRVLNVDSEKKLISSRYIFDCVKKNYLLDMNEYLVKITEVATSDISDEDSLNLISKISNDNDIIKFQKDSDTPVLIENDISVISTDGNEMICSNLDLTTMKTTDFQNTTFLPASNPAAALKEYSSLNKSADILPISSPKQLQELEPIHVDSLTNKNVPLHEDCNKSIEDFDKSIDDCDKSFTLHDNPADGMEAAGIVQETELSLDLSAISSGDKGEINVSTQVVQNIDLRIMEKVSPISPIIVSSSQPTSAGEVLDGFDNLVLNKMNEKPETENGDSSHNTVSSSQDAQVAKSPPKVADNSCEIFAGVPSLPIPDSAVNNSQTIERQMYIENLEAEVECILQKPSPKSIQDKICLVKYICCVKKLPPSVVLQSLQNL